MYKFRLGSCKLCGKLIGKSLSSNKCSVCYWEKKQPQYIDRKKPDKERKAMKEAYKREYWQGVKNGTIRRGIQFKTVATSKPGEPLTFKVIYEDQPGYDEASFLIP